MRNIAGLSCSILALAAVSVAPARAQAAPEPSDGEVVEPAPEDIIVTGSRIARSTFETPSPVTVVAVEDLEKSSPSTLAAALNNLPSLVAGGGPNATSGQRTAGRNNLNLRGIGVGRTLVLVNGHRYPGSAPGGTVDTNLIPQGLVSRVEVVTGGASAAYGSDAIAGVVNFILDKRYNGLKASASAGITERGDGHEHRASITFGESFAGDRLHLTMSGEYYRNDGIDGDGRAQRRRGPNLIVNPAVTATNPASAENPALIMADEARLNSTYGGLIVTATGGTPAGRAALLGRQFLTGRVPAPYDFGTSTTATLQDGGDGVNTAILQPITRPLERRTFYAGLEWQATDALTLYVNGSYAWSRASNASSAYHSGRNAIRITRDNAFLPAAVRSQMVSGGVTAFTMNRFDGEYDIAVVATNKNKRVEAGLTLEVGGLTFDLSGQYGHNVENAPNYNNFLVDRYAEGVDSVLVAGVPTCRSTLTNPGNGCVPIDPFGAGSYTPQMIGYFTATSQLKTTVEQKIVQGNLSGSLFEGIGAGSWEFAVGAEHRRDDAKVEADALSAANAFFTNNQTPWGAGRSVSEAYGEINAPLLRDVPGARLLEVNGAARYTHYSTSGGVTTWKVGVNWKPFEDLRLRGTISRDIRAPNHAELFTKGRSQFAAYNDPFMGGARVTNILTTVQGNPELFPERADTKVFGVVYEPSWLPGLSLSADRFDIRLKDAIRSLSGQAVLDQCFEGFEQVCDQIERDGAGNLVSIFNSNFNLDRLRLTGYDFEGRFSRPLAGGRITLRAQAAYLERLVEQDSNNVTVDRSGETETPKWRALAAINFDKGPLNLFLQGRYIGPNKLDNDWGPADSEYNNVPAALYVDGQIGVRVAEKFRVALNVQNLFDKAPVFAPQQDTYYSPTNANVYDQIGRTYRVSVNVDF